jgi:polyphenol oxidase
MSIPTEMITDNLNLKDTSFYWHNNNGLKILRCKPLEELGFTNGFSTRLGGVSPFPQNALNLAGFDDDTTDNIMENRRRFLTLFDGKWTLALSYQVHSPDVRIVTEKQEAEDHSIKCDALTTNIPDILLGIKTADCVPILLADTRTKSIAAVHAGWRGTLSSILINTFEEMQKRYSSKAEDIHAAIGPAALQCCYEVGEDVIQAFKERFSYATSLFIPTGPNNARIDLHKANKEQLLSLGIPNGQIYIAPLCTMCHTELFFSYRKEKRLYGATGRLMAVIGRKE